MGNEIWIDFLSPCRLTKREFLTFCGVNFCALSGVRKVRLLREAHPGDMGIAELTQAQLVTEQTRGILEYWKSGTMIKKYASEIFFSLPNIPIFHYSIIPNIEDLSWKRNCLSVVLFAPEIRITRYLRW